MLDSKDLYVFEDISFINTAEFQETGNYFRKHEVYTKAPKGSLEYEEFWNLEEERRIIGMKAYGKLTADGIEEIRVTGEHYGFLNYAPILRTTDTEEKAEFKKVSKRQRKSGAKSLDFPDFMDGQYHYFKVKEHSIDYGQNIVVAKARRKGFSYIEAWDSADSINMNPHKTVLLTAFDLKYLTKGDQMMGMGKRYLDWLEKYTDFARGYLHRQTDYVELGYTPEGTKLPEGFESKLMALSFGPANPDAAIGKDAYKIKVEEAGKAPNLEDFLEVTLSTMEDGDLQTGNMVIFGTGGTKDANWETFDSIYYNPNSINAVAFRNIWDEGMYDNEDGCGFFYPHRLTLRPHIDEHGNSLFEAADVSIVEKRAYKKKTAKTPSEYTRYISQRANNGQEAFNSNSGNILPDVNDQLHKVLHDPAYKYLGQYGMIENTAKGLDFVIKDDVSPILNYPLKKADDLEGCVVFWYPPYRNREGKIPSNLYRLWNDPYGVDKDKKDIKITDSLAATYIYERMNPWSATRGDIIIGAYVGRPEMQETYNNQLTLLTMFLNGMCAFENDRGDDVKKTFRKWKQYHRLVDEPDFDFNPELSGKHGRKKGINMTNPKRKAAALVYFRDWLNTVRGRDSVGNIIKNYHMIYDPAFLNEINKYKMDKNADRVSSALVGMFDMEEVDIKTMKYKENENINNSYIESIMSGKLFMHE